MTAEFRYAGWNPTRGTVPVYIVDRHSGQITIGEVLVLDGEPCDGGGEPLRNYHETTNLVGWRHTTCQSFNEGGLLVPLKGSRA